MAQRQQQQQRQQQKSVQGLGAVVPRAAAATAEASTAKSDDGAFGIFTASYDFDQVSRAVLAALTWRYVCVCGGVDERRGAPPLWQPPLIAARCLLLPAPCRRTQR